MSLESSPPARNAPCQCGSGRRYKDCHGALATARAAPYQAPDIEAPARGGYRPAGPDWDHLDETDRATCGSLMQRALRQQVAGKLTEAAAHYMQVLALAPNTHDALHMLGAIELRRGNLSEARQLIIAAAKLRPLYPDLEHNLRMAQDLERAARVSAGRAVPPPEALCEKALPMLVDLALRPAPAQPGASGALAKPAGDAKTAIHLVAGVRASSDDGAWLLGRLAALLAPERPTIWCAEGDREPGAQTRALAPGVGGFPEGGCHVFVGIDIDCSEWIERGSAERVVVLCQPAAPSHYLRQLRAIARDGARRVELVFPSRAMSACFGAGHAVLAPPIATDAEFAGEPRAAAASGRGFTAGLIGRLWQAVSPNEDAHFLRRLGVASERLEIYDPGALRYVVGLDPAVRCRVRGTTAMRRFLRSVDCLLHTGGRWWLEGDGRELFLAMADGVPIVCPRASIFAEYIEDGVDGLLYDERDEALEHLERLRRTPTLRAELARAVQAKMAALVSAERAAENVRRIVLGEIPAPDSSSPRAVREPLAAR
jgi:hypothetical protein